MTSMATAYRTHTCGELRRSHVEALQGAPVKLAGFVDAPADGLGLLLRDRYGRTLLRAAPDALPHVAYQLSKLAAEDIARVEGRVVVRQLADATLPTGGVVVEVSDVEVLARARGVDPEVLRGEELSLDHKLAFRPLYLRRADVQARLGARSRIAQAIRSFLVHERFLEIETPHLFWYDRVATGPEPVPVRGGKSFALPSGPVVLDQYILAGQFDRFFQLLRVTRREDHPTRRHQPEYTGLDMNFAYADGADARALIERMLAHAWRAVRGNPLPIPFPSLTYAEALLRFGTDKPDLRIDLELVDLPGPAGAPVVRALVLAGDAARLWEADLDALIEAAAASPRRATLGWARIGPRGALDGPAAALLADRSEAVEAGGAGAGDLMLTSAAPAAYDAAIGAGRLRLAAARALGCIDRSRPRPVWITEYPFMQPDERGDHVPNVVVFSQTHPDDLALVFEGAPEERDRVRSLAFDLVLDGVELASGYVGHHSLQLQRVVWERIFQMQLEDLIRLRAPVESHRFGVPPHVGVNVGFDRLVAGMLGVDEIDEVMAFPKTHACADPLLNAPGPIDEEAAADLLEVAPEPVYTVDDLLAEVLAS